MTIAPNGTQNKKYAMPQYGKKHLKELFTEMIIDEMPFIIVEGKGFCKFYNAMEFRFLLPSQYTVMQDCMKMHSKE